MESTLSTNTQTSRNGKQIQRTTPYLIGFVALLFNFMSCKTS